jgi:transposase-like protein
MLKKNQLAAIQLIIYSDKPDCAIAEEVGVNPSTLWRWKQTEEFQQKLEEENRRKFKDLQTQALKAMENLIKNGSFQAAKYILDGNNYAPTEKHEMQLDAKIEVDYGED